MRLLEIEVTGELLDLWREYLAPDWQPFFVRQEDGFSAPESGTAHELTDDLRCTYTGWRIRDRTKIIWFNEESFMDLPRAERARLVRLQVDVGRGAVPSVRRWEDHFDVRQLRSQADGHRFVWWRSLLDRNPEPVIRAQVEDGQLATRHREVSEETWRAAHKAVPGARDIAGAFSRSSGPNCFGATIAAAGRASRVERVLQEPFESFLRERCIPGGRYEDPGTVLVWRDRSGLPFHSAVSIGDGWGLEKAAETWWTPTIVADLGQLVKINRSAGLKLERHRLAVGR